MKFNTHMQTFIFLIALCLLSCESPKTPFAIPIGFSKNINLSGFYESQQEMVFDINYYKNKIIEYRNFFDERHEISTIVKIDSIVPGLLSFLVC